MRDDRIIEIRDPEINSEEVVNRIEERAEKRRAQARAQGIDYNRFVEDIKSPNLAAPSSTVDDDLQKLRAATDGLWVSLAQNDRRLRFFNGTLFRLENLFHRLVVKYVNMLAGRQIIFNREAVDTLSTAVYQLREYDTRLSAMEKRLSELETRLNQADNKRAP